MNHTTVQRYILGFLLSLALTLVAFSLVEQHRHSGHRWGGHGYLLMSVSALAVLQIIVQVRYFLHLGKEEAQPHYKSVAFVYTFIMVLFIVGGSLWIMNNLNYNMMSPMQMDAYMSDK